MGNLRKYMPVTFITMAMGWLAICGIPIWAGFFSKDEILYKTFAADNYFPGGPFPGNEVLWAVAALTAVLTAVYMTRMMVMTFWGNERFHDPLPGEDGHLIDHHDDAAHGAVHDDDDDEEHHHALPADFKPHESPWTMTVPLVILAILSTAGGLIGVPYAMSSLVGAKDVNVFEHTLEPVVAEAAPGEHGAHAVAGDHSTAAQPRQAASETHDTHSPEVVAKERMLALLSVVLAAFGIGVGWFAFRNNPLRRMPKILEEKWRLDELYNGYIVDPLTNLSRNTLWKGFDVGFVDGIVNGIGHFVIEFGGVVRRLQVGFVRSYAAIILLGALAVIGYFIYYGWKLVV
jgi:NADH-quinone oxidoreductase subunit L